MIKQRENDWNKRYREKDTPWEEDIPSLELQPLLEQYAYNKKSLLEIGCGLGTNAFWFARLGYDVEATDLSEESIHAAEQRKSIENLSNIKFYPFDIIKDSLHQKFDIVFDKGCMHSFLTQDSYNFFAQKVSQLLADKGVWIHISGNSDNPDDHEKRRQLSFPRLSLRNIAIAVEPYFEILEVKRGQFGQKNGFYSWVGIFKKRSYFYES